MEEIYPYASGYSKEHEDYLKEAQGATALLQDGNRGYRALWEHVLNVSIADLKKNYDKLDVHLTFGKGKRCAGVYSGYGFEIKRGRICL